jgi:lysylphosphatidylglycerol synthetase-like protein (DUF2156 family)
MSDALLRHHLGLLINPFWSPLYPFLIGVGTWLARPSAYWEFPLVHLMNFFIFLGALVSFEFLLRQVINVLGKRSDQRDTNLAPLPAWAWYLLGYSLFGWSTFVMVNGLRKVTPDLCVATLVFLDAGLVLKLQAGSKKSHTYLLLGFTLALGYLAKAIMFPMAFVFMGIAFLAGGGRGKAVLPSTAMLLVFSAMSAPLFIGISKSAGQSTFGESGTVNYALYVEGDRLPPFDFADPLPNLEHPVHRIYEHPSVYEFGQPFPSTYPLSFDHWYWYNGVKIQLNLRRQLKVIGESLTVFYANLVLPMWGLIAGFLILLFMSPDLPQCLRRIARGWALLVMGAAAPALYTLVHVEPRYIGPFVLLVWLGLFSGIRLERSRDSARLGTIATLAISGSLAVLIVQFVFYHLAEPLPILRGRGGTYYQVAESLNKAGVRPGEAVAVIGPGWDGMFWARLARVRIVAEIPPEDKAAFWLSGPSVIKGVLETISGLGVKAIVTHGQPESPDAQGWRKLGPTDYYARMLP